MRTALVGVTLLGLLALAAAGSAGGEWGGGLEERSVPGALVDYAFTFGVLIVLAVLAIAVWALTGPSTGRKLERPRGTGLSGFALVLVALAYFAYTDTRPRIVGGPDQGGVPQRQSSTGADAGTAADRSSDRPEFQWWVALGVALAIGAIVVKEWRRRPPREPGAADELEAVLTETLGELELDPDPRRAVIQAYVRMEGVLGAHGHGRLPHEAPLEYLARVLRELDVRAEAAHALTELFERARFSHHEIDAAMRTEAVASLEAVRDDLRAAA
jgi:hypothetical protein